MGNNENIRLEWAGDVPYQMFVGTDVIWRNDKVTTALPNVTATVITIPKLQAIKFARIFYAGLQAGKLIEMGELLKVQTEKLLMQQEAFRGEVIKFGISRMIKDAKKQAHSMDCPRCDICEREECEGCEVAKYCKDSTCTSCPEKAGCYEIASEDNAFIPDDDEDEDEGYEDEDEDEDEDDEDDDDFWGDYNNDPDDFWRDYSNDPDENYNDPDENYEVA